MTDFVPTAAQVEVRLTEWTAISTRRIVHTAKDQIHTCPSRSPVGSEEKRRLGQGRAGGGSCGQR